MKRLATLGVVAVLSLGVLAACDTDSETANLDSSSETTKPTTTTVDSVTSEKDLVDTAIAAGDFTTLVAAVQAAGLEETLRGEGPFTVFAPTDDAFAALPDGTVETLLQDPTGALKSILTYHVVAGKVMAADVVTMDGDDVPTVNGATFTIEVDEGSVTLLDAAGNEVGVVATDIETSNGAIHVIDAVLLPS